MSDFLSQEEIDAMLKGGLEETEEKKTSASGQKEDAASRQKESAVSAKKEDAASGQRKLEIILQIPVRGRVVLAKTQRSLSELTDLQTGKIVETNKNVSEFVDFCINDKIVARGEIVVVDENFGLRIKHILTPEDRIQQLK